MRWNGGHRIHRKDRRDGGAVKAIERQFYQNEIAESAYATRRRSRSKEKVIVGVNEFVVPEGGIRKLEGLDMEVNSGKSGAYGLSVRGGILRESLQLLQGLDRPPVNRKCHPHNSLLRESLATLGEISICFGASWGTPVELVFFSQKRGRGGQSSLSVPFRHFGVLCLQIRLPCKIRGFRSASHLSGDHLHEIEFDFLGSRLFREPSRPETSQHAC